MAPPGVPDVAMAEELQQTQYSLPLPSHNLEHGHQHDHDHDHHHDHESSRKSQHPPSKHADMHLSTFLHEHIPASYNPTGVSTSSHVHKDHDHDGDERTRSTKFCYRHHPDLKCRRQADETSMEQLQEELSGLPQSDQQLISQVWASFSAAPGKQRKLMLQGILAQCCFPQLSFISAGIRDLIKIDFLNMLPSELGFKILCYLDTTSLCKAAQVSQRWRSLADDDVVWHKMCQQHIDRKCTKCGWGLPLLDRKRLRVEKRQMQLRATGMGLNQCSPNITPTPGNLQSLAIDGPGIVTGEAGSSRGTKRSMEGTASASPELSKRHCSTSSQESAIVGIEGNEAYFAPRKRPWKSVYKDRFQVSTAWKYGRCSTKIFKGHTNGVMALQFEDNVLITGSYDTTVKVWNIKTGEEIRTLTGHSQGIRALQFKGDKLMTGSLDSTVKLWNWREGKLLKTWQAHDGGVISVHFTQRYQASGSQDKNIRVWDSTTGQTFLLRGHKDWVNSVKIDDASRTLFSASDDLTIRIWDLDSRQCIREFTGHVGQVQQVVPMPPEFNLDDMVLTPNDKDDDTSSVSSVTIAPSHREHNHRSPDAEPSFWPEGVDRPAPPRYMITGALDSTIRLWDTHFKTTRSGRDVTPDFDQHGSSILPTDPLTSSHYPRAQACIRTFFGHVEGVWALSADHLRLISGSEDKMMKVWDPRTGKCDRTFTGHQGPVTCSWLSDSRVASGSEDCEVRMLCFGDEEHRHGADE